MKAKNVTLVLTGPMAGKTILLQHHQFIDGKVTLAGDNQTAIRYLGRCYQAFPEGSDELKKALPDYGILRNAPQSPSSDGANSVSGHVDGPAGPVQTPPAVHVGSDGNGVAPGGTPGVLPGGSGHQDAGLVSGQGQQVVLPPEQVNSIRRVIHALDPKQDAHWTAEGKPSLEVVSATTGIPTLSRAMIDAVDADYDRDDAAEAAVEAADL